MQWWTNTSFSNYSPLIWEKMRFACGHDTVLNGVIQMGCHGYVLLWNCTQPNLCSLASHPLNWVACHIYLMEQAYHEIQSICNVWYIVCVLPCCPLLGCIHAFPHEASIQFHPHGGTPYRTLIAEMWLANTDIVLIAILVCGR